jgi:membrane-associated protein
MIGSATLTSLIASHGIAILAPLAVIEGPIVTVVAAYLARLSLLNLADVIICVIIADLVGDCLFYWLGRSAPGWLPAWFRERIGASPARIEQLSRTFRDKGMRVLVIGKLTHAAGFAALLAAGAARMPLASFLLANLLATIPKSLALVALGYAFGGAHDLIASWLSAGSIVIFAVLALGLIAFIYLRRRAAT